MELDPENVAPVDPELFVVCSHAYHEGARFPLVPPAKGPGLYLADIPINRGMMSVLNELKHRGASDAIKHAIMWRLMHFDEVFKNEKLKPFMQSSDSPGAVMVSEALIKACAEAKFVVEGEHSRFDIDDVARIAQKLFDEDEAGSNGETQ
jgi:hypothetical protein